MLETRRARFAENRPAAMQAVQQNTLESLDQGRAQLAVRLAGIETRNDPLGLANRKELQQWQQLESIAARLAQLPPAAQTAALQEKQQLLQGILIWRLNADYKARLQQARQQLGELDALSADARKALDKLQRANLDTPDDFGAFSRRIQQQRDKLQQLQSQTTRTRLAQGARIEQLAVSELGQQQQRLDSYIIQARFALAQTYDDALQGNNGATP
jgi:hypothetical protein